MNACVCHKLDFLFNGIGDKFILKHIRRPMDNYLLVYMFLNIPRDFVMV